MAGRPRGAARPAQPADLTRYRWKTAFGLPRNRFARIRFDRTCWRTKSCFAFRFDIFPTLARNLGLIRKVALTHRFDLTRRRTGLAIGLPRFFLVTGTALVRQAGRNRAGHFSLMCSRLPSKTAVSGPGLAIGLSRPPGPPWPSKLALPPSQNPPLPPSSPSSVPPQSPPAPAAR